MHLNEKPNGGFSQYLKTTFKITVYKKGLLHPLRIIILHSSDWVSGEPHLFREYYNGLFSVPQLESFTCRRLEFEFLEKKVLVEAFLLKVECR